MTKPNQVPSTRVARARRLLTRAKALVCDIDGVLLINGKAVPGAEKLLASHRCVFVSNNSTHCAKGMAEVFARQGLTAAAEDFFLAGETAVRLIAERPGRPRVLLLASGEVLRLAQELLHLVDNRPDIVLLCRDLDVTFGKLEAAANAIAAGAQLVVSNPDFTHPAAAGFHMETGALWQALMCQLPSSALAAQVVGKPHVAMVNQALAHLRLGCEDAVFLGDNVATDATAARSAGMSFVHVDPQYGVSLESLC